jgi:hypothetical protein
MTFNGEYGLGPRSDDDDKQANHPLPPTGFWLRLCLRERVQILAFRLSRIQLPLSSVCGRSRLSEAQKEGGEAVGGTNPLINILGQSSGKSPPEVLCTICQGKETQTGYLKVAHIPSHDGQGIEDKVGQSTVEWGDTGIRRSRKTEGQEKKEGQRRRRRRKRRGKRRRRRNRERRKRKGRRKRRDRDNSMS